MLKKNRLANSWAFFLCLIMWSGVEIVYAGFGIDLSTYVAQDQNAFQNYEELPDLIIQPSLTLSYTKQWSTTYIRTYYEGGYAFFKTYTQRVFQTHYGGFTIQQYLGESGPVLSAGLQAGKRTNSDSLYTFYNYNHYLGYFNLRKTWNTHGMSMIGVWHQVRQYEKIPEFDYGEFRCFVQQNIFFPTRTTLIARVQLGYKKFLKSTVSESVVQELVPRMDDPESGSAGGRGQGGSEKGGGSGGNGTGRGNNSGNNRSDSVDLQNRSISQADTSYETVNRTVRVELPGKEILQWKYSLRIAQSVSSKTGLAVECRIHRKAEGNGRLLSYQDSGYEADDPLTDDPYNYNSNTYSLQLTQKLPWAVVLKGGWDDESRQYDYMALDLYGEALSDSSMRNDRRSLLWMSLQKRFSLGRIRRAEVSFSYHYIKNQSNEAYSNYQDQVFSFGWSLGF